VIVSFRYFRLYKPLAPSTFAINEIQFYGVLVYNTGSIDASCPLQVFASPTSIPVNSTTFINYKDSLTSLLTKVDPKYGTTLGGVNVTLTGTNFGNLISDISVLIDGVSCKVFFVK
jgi:IPT/TIG domain.